jgi:hypothetical protein
MVESGNTLISKNPPVITTGSPAFIRAKLGQREDVTLTKILSSSHSTDERHAPNYEQKPRTSET